MFDGGRLENVFKTMRCLHGNRENDDAALSTWANRKDIISTD